MTIQIEKAPDTVFPKCPHCKHRLDKLWMKPRGTGFIQQQQIIICPKCETFLGYGSIKIFG
jgi:hypothetical protein